MDETVRPAIVETAKELVKTFRRAAEGDSGDDEFAAGWQLMEFVAAYFGIEIEEEDEDE